MLYILSTRQRLADLRPCADASPALPKIVKPRFDEVVGLTDAVCRTHLTDEYAALARELTARISLQQRLGERPTYVMLYTFN